MCWLISSINHCLLHEGLITTPLNDHVKYSIPKLRSLKKYKIKIFLDGYILPRFSYYKSLSSYKSIELIGKLYSEEGCNFIHKIKGVYTIIIVDENVIHIFNDHHSLKRFFYHQDECGFIVSNSIDRILENVNTRPDFESLAQYCLMEHFTGGKTAFKGLLYSEFATHAVMETKLKIDTYWTPQTLFNKPRIESWDLNDSEFWQLIINQYISYLEQKKVAVTLTGGIDSRMVLSAFDLEKTEVSAFNYGDLRSADSATAREIAERIDIKYSSYSFQGKESSWYKKTADEVLQIGQSLINLHRSHRLDAAKRFKNDNKTCMTLFTGLLGGEYYKGIKYDDYIIPKLLRLLEKKKFVGIDETVIFLLNSQHFNTNTIDTSKLISNILSLPIFNTKKKKHREFLYAFYLYGATHHSQDSILWNNMFPYIINPFMDIDVLEYQANHKTLFFSRKYPLFRIWNSRNQIKITHQLNNTLSNIPYAKRIPFSANDILNNPIKALIKKLTNQTTARQKPSFSYGRWFATFCEEELEELHPIIIDAFHIEKISKEMAQDNLRTTEKDWHTISNIVNLNRLLLHYDKS